MLETEQPRNHETWNLDRTWRCLAADAAVTPRKHASSPDAHRAAGGHLTCISELSLPLPRGDARVAAPAAGEAATTDHHTT